MITYNKKNEPKIELNYSLNYKDYIENLITCPIGYKIIKLGEICEIYDGYAFKTNEMRENGMELVQISNINNYKIDKDIKKCIKYKKEYEKYTIKKGDIILGMTGNLEHKIALYSNDTIKILNQRVCKLINFENREISNYIYFYWLGRNIGKFIEKQANGSVQKNISKQQLKNLEIAIPINMETIKSELEKLFELHETINKINNLIEIKEKEIQKKIKYIIENDECEIKLLKDICEIKSGNPINKDKRNGILYPYYAANGISGYVNEYLFDGKYIICAQDGSIGAIHLVNEKFYASNHTWVLEIKDIHIMYIYNILKYFVDYKMITSGSVIPKITKQKIGLIKINIPKDKTIIENLEIYFQEIENLKLELHENEKLYKLKIQELFNDFN
jgi:type I restriction enzyme S subunit